MEKIWKLECCYNDDVFYFSSKEKAEGWLARRSERKNDWWLDWYEICDDQ